MTDTGLYLILSKGIPTAVQTKDEEGNSLPVPLTDYINRAVQPKWETLPTEAQFQQSGNKQ